MPRDPCLRAASPRLTPPHARPPRSPNFCHINGDCIYGDNAIDAVGTQFFNKGRKFVTAPGVETLPAASDLASFRARYRYHLEDGPLSSFLAHTPVFNTWDDHEITDDWGPHLRVRATPNRRRRPRTGRNPAPQPALRL